MGKLLALVIEDEAAMRLLYERVLLKCNCEVVFARDGQQGLDLLLQYTPELIFLDMLLPVISGVGILRAIADLPRIASHAHVVIASSSKDYEQYVQWLPSCQFILKPILPTQIRDIALRLNEAKQAR